MYLQSLLTIIISCTLISAQTDNTEVEVTATIPILVIQSSELQEDKNASSIPISATIQPTTHVVLPDYTTITAVTSVAGNSSSATMQISSSSHSVFISTEIISSESIYSTSHPASESLFVSSSSQSDSIQVSTSIDPWIASSSNVVLSSSATVYPTTSAVPDVVYECGDECKSLKKKLYAAAAFAILFLVVILVLGGLLYRQHQISREYRDDPSLSRLI
ncbi:uncharacterized protein [Clytia hemisphaerica]|uniref:Cnidarian restricted protein n=1 Tax=Clytia hemisphaerica TaxID=252671 RepID=A0A7M5UGS7_9CNID